MLCVCYSATLPESLCGREKMASAPLPRGVRKDSGAHFAMVAGFGVLPAFRNFSIRSQGMWSPITVPW